MRPYRSFYRTLFAKICIIAFASVLAGCSALRLGYNNGESVAYWWLDSYIDIEATQDPMIKRHLGGLFAWHRATQLADYAQLLTHGQQRLQHNVTHAEVLEDYETVSKRIMTIIDRALPELSDLTLSLQLHQIAHLEQKFASTNEKYRKEYLRGSVEHRQLYRYKKAIKQAEYWFGDFTAEQEAQIRQASDERPLNNELWAAERMRRQHELIALLKRIQEERPSRDTTMQLLKAYVAASIDHFGDVRHKEFFSSTREGTAKMAAVIMNIADDEQKAHAAKRLQQLINDCLALAEKARATAHMGNQ